MVSDKKFYIMFEGNRLYHYNMDVYDLFYSELFIHFTDHLNLGAKIFYLKSSSKHVFSLTKFDLIYLSDLFARREEDLKFVFSENIKKIKFAQKNDLFFITNLNNLYFVCLIPKLTDNDLFYFELIIGVKPGFDINQFNNWSLQSINIKSILELNSFNLNENLLKNIFCFEKNKFRDYSINEVEDEIYSKHFSKPLNDINTKLTKKGRRFYKKFIFKHICCHFYWLGGYYQFKNAGYLIDFGYKEKFIIKNEKNELEIKEVYPSFSIIDLLCENEESLCFSSWQIYEDL